MKYLLVLFLFLSACASNGLSDYSQGCVDGYMESLRVRGDSFSDYLKNPENEKFVRENLSKFCESMEASQKEVRAYPKNR